MTVPFRVDTNPLGRDTRATIVDTCDHQGRPLRLFLSYDTVIAVECGDDRARRANDWGPTTGRHFSDFVVKDWPVVAGFPAYVRAHYGLDIR